MISENTNDVLNRLLALHCRSLPTYLSYAAPWLHRGNEGAAATLKSVVADQQQISDRIGEAIVDNEGVVDYGEFPMDFTSYHDVSFDFLLDKLIDRQQAMVSEIEECVDELRLAPSYQALAQEALGMAKGHLDLFQELDTRSAIFQA
jgi:hypothetical protein